MLLAPAAIASSAVKSAAYVYALCAGSMPGIACLPFAPTVYSVALTCSWLTGCWLPSGITRLALVS